jgi:general secretion pathway protein G
MKRSKLNNQNGYSLLELIITMSVITVLIVSAIPLAQNSIKRQKEAQLREALRTIRLAIDEFKRDTIGACPQGSTNSSNPINNQQNFTTQTDPRSRVVIDDCKIFDTENLDRYPPSLDILVEGVRVKSRIPATMTGGAGIGDRKDENFSDLNNNKEVTKYYLREIPVDPFTGKTDSWVLRSTYQAKDSGSWDDINVFDVSSGSEEEALNGEKYSDW